MRTLELRNVCKNFAGIPAVANVTFQAREGEITGYLGPNGSGKSTTMKMITGLIETTAGEIFFDGKPIRSDLLAFKQRLGYVPEEPYLYSHLSGLEYLTMVSQLRDLPAKAAADRIDSLLYLLSLHADRHAAISSYSKGMRQKILLSAALLHNPDLILLDEPFSGLDVSTSMVLRSLIQELAARGKVAVGFRLILPASGRRRLEVEVYEDAHHEPEDHTPFLLPWPTCKTSARHGNEGM